MGSWPADKLPEHAGNQSIWPPFLYIHWKLTALTSINDALCKRLRVFVEKALRVGHIEWIRGRVEEVDW